MNSTRKILGKNKAVEMTVTLKVPDTTAITALQTLHKIGFGKIKDVKRYDYYKFLIEGDEEKFRNSISKVDSLVNVNKHLFSFEIKKDDSVNVLVKNIDDSGVGILSILNDRLGFSGIKKAEKAVLWSLSIDAQGSNAKKIAEKAAKELLANENYQEYSII